MQRVKNALLRGLIRAALFVTDRIPASAMAGLGRLVGAVVYVTAPALRRRARIAARDGLGVPRAGEISRRAFTVAGESLARCLLLRRAAFRALDVVTIPASSREVLARATAEGRGVVFVSAHLGPFELVAAAVSELGFDTVVVVRESYDPLLDATVDAHREARGIEVIHRGKPRASLRAARALERGAVVGVLPDLRTRAPGRPVEMLGGTAEVPAGFARLASATGARIVVGALDPVDRGYRLLVTPVPSDSGGDVLQSVMSEVSRRIEAWPEGWLWPASPVRPRGPIATGSA